MTRLLNALLPVLGAAVLMLPAAGAAQIRASELQSISQVVDGTKVTIEYSRPRLRGRDVVFGTRAVRWGEVWTPGANWATTLETDRPITLSGVRVPKGKYGLWMIVQQDSSWTMLLDPVWRQFHMAHPEPSDRHIKVNVRADSTATWSEEALTFSFPAVTARGATIAMHWHRMRISMNYTVEPTLSELLPESEATQYLGRYALKGNPPDTTAGALIVTYEGGGLKARFEPEDTYFQTFALMRVAPGIFTAGLYMAAEVFAAGEIYEVLRPDYMLTFAEKDGRMQFEVRGSKDELYFSGRRVSEQAAAAQTLTIPKASAQIAAATLALPEAMRANATVLGYRTAARLERLRQGTNGMTCLAHNPADVDRFHVACYHDSLEPFMARGRELRSQGVSVSRVDTVRFAEVASGKLKMPTSGALYSLTGPAGDFDEAKVAAPKSRLLFVVYLPGATEQSTGLSTIPLVGQPWLMLPGTPKAHIMFVQSM